MPAKKPESAPKTVKPAAKATVTPAEGPAPAAPRPPFRRPAVVNFAGVGRNDLCPCGSGKRFKNCHGR